MASAGGADATTPAGFTARAERGGTATVTPIRADAPPPPGSEKPVAAAMNGVSAAIADGSESAGAGVTPVATNGGDSSDASSGTRAGVAGAGSGAATTPAATTPAATTPAAPAAGGETKEAPLAFAGGADGAAAAAAEDEPRYSPESPAKMTAAQRKARAAARRRKFAPAMVHRASSLRALEEAKKIPPVVYSDKVGVDVFADRLVISGFTVQAKLGAGAFAEVNLVYRDDDGAGATPGYGGGAAAGAGGDGADADVDDVPGRTYFAMKHFSRSRLRSRRETMREPGKRRMIVKTALDKVKEEINIMASVRHPHVVALLEVLDDTEIDALYLVLEYCDAATVAEWDKSARRFRSELSDRSDGLLSDDAARQVIRDAALGLQYLHSLGIVHRDIKPDNLLMTSKGFVKVADLGVAKKLTPEEQAAGGILKNSEGTHQFFSPEASSGDPYNAYATDVWALGVTLYVLVFGTLPWFKPNVVDLFDSIVDDPLVIPDTASDQVRAVLEGLLEKDPDVRWTLDELLDHEWIRAMDSMERIHFPAQDRSALRPPNHSTVTLQLMAEAAAAQRPQGWLLKRGQRFKSWKLRYFDFLDDQLVYSIRKPDEDDDADDGGRKGSLDMSQLQDVKEAPKPDKPFRFCVTFNDRPLYMQASTQENRDMWMRFFQVQLATNRAKAAAAAADAAVAGKFDVV